MQPDNEVKITKTTFSQECQHLTGGLAQRRQ